MKINKNPNAILFSGSLILLALIITVSLLSFGTALQIPSGANVTSLSNETAPIASPGVQNAIAGNVTSVNIVSLSTTQSWQGYYGNITGTVVLADASNNQMYNWSVGSPVGQVYASTANNLDWYNIQCFNYTATGAINPAGENGGSWNQKGMNLSQLQNTYGINATDSDSVNNTFYLGGTNSHTTFFVANWSFSDTLCNSTLIYDNTAGPVATHFQEILQYEPTTNAVVFTSILNNDLPGFDQKQHDFEMLVLVNGHGTNTSTIPYYFYAQIA
jgi:hypothetical protein